MIAKQATGAAIVGPSCGRRARSARHRFSPARIPADHRRRPRSAAVAVIWRDAAPILAQLDAIRTATSCSSLLGGAGRRGRCSSLVFRGGQGRMTRQTRDLARGGPPRPADRDPQPRRARRGPGPPDRSAPGSAGGTVGVALLDIDNFRLLNDDLRPRGRRLRPCPTVADLLEVGRPAGDDHAAATGRTSSWSIVPAAGVAGLEPIIERLRDRARRLSASQFDASERLPRHGQRRHLHATRTNGESVTALLSTGGRDPARGQGERRRRDPGGRRGPAGAPRRRQTFDVLEGLVIAVDTKDRYTTPPLRGRRPLRRLPGRAARPRPGHCARRSTGPGCSTTSARSASPTGSCASPAS